MGPVSGSAQGPGKPASIEDECLRLDRLREKLRRDRRSRRPREPGDQPIAFTWHSLSPSLQLRYTEDYAARKHALQPLSLPPRGEHGRIRLAYLSSDFREHPISYMFVRLLERHDRALFEVIGLSFGPDDKSSMRERIQRAFDRFIDVCEN